MDPYRDALVRVEPRALVAEPERPPRGVRVRAWNDGTTVMTLRMASPHPGRALYSLLTAVFGAAALHALPAHDAGGGAVMASFAALLLLRTLRGERISVSPAAIAVRPRFGAADVRALADVSTVVVSGSDKAARLELQCGRERVPVADGLGYDDETLRWIAQRLRRAVDEARR